MVEPSLIMDQRVELTWNHRNPNAAVDIVFIHGLGAHPNLSWPANPNLSWPASYQTGHDFFDRIPSARVLTYGYNVHTCGFQSENELHQGLNNLAKCFLENVLLARRTELERNRPMIFLGHSFGGLVIKEALNIGKNPQLYQVDDPLAYRSIFKHTHGIIILGIHHSENPHSQQRIALASALPVETSTFRSSGIDQDFPGSILRQTQCIVAFWYEICLPLAQAASCLVAGSYNPRMREALDLKARTGSAFPTNNGRGGLWPCSLFGSYSSRTSDFCMNFCQYYKYILDLLLNPSPTLFVFAALAYAISATAYYQRHSHHKYQYSLLLLGLGLGVFTALFLHIVKLPLNVVIIITPATITYVLLCSAIGHSIRDMVYPDEVEQTFRLLRTLASNLPAREKGIIADEPAYFKQKAGRS